MKKAIKAVAFDLDGTIYTGNTLVEGAAETVQKLEDAGKQVFYFTNNSVKTRTEVLEKLTVMGLRTDISHVYNSGYAAGIFVRELGLRSMCCVGSKGLKSELMSQGIEINDENSDAVIVGMDSGFCYQDIAKALNALRRGAILIACNRDRNYPVENGRLLPGCGSLVASIEYAANIKAKYIVGKPHTFMMELLSSEHRVSKEEIIVIGDTYDSDIIMARNYRCDSILISQDRKVKNTIVVSGISEILGYLI